MPDQNPTITAQEVVDTFAQTPNTKRIYHQWTKRRPHVTERVMAHSSRAVYNVASAAVRRLASEHPLGDIKAEDGFRVSPIKNWNPDFAFIHLFHFALEQIGRVYSFGEFRSWAAKPENQWMLYDEADALVHTVQERLGAGGREARDAMAWRIGLAYYSFLRELYTVARLREAGLDMRVHPLADALFRADAWNGRVVFELYVSNSEFRSGSDGRKYGAEGVLAEGRPELRFVSLRMEKQHVYGRVHLPEEAQLQVCAEQIRAAAAS